MFATSPRILPLVLAFATSPLLAAPAASEVLWSQTGHDAGVQVISQNFEASFDLYDNQGADDFVVPPGEVWLVRQVEVMGTYGEGTGPARSENVFFYGDAGGLPGAPLAAHMEVAGQGDWEGHFLITLPEPLKLREGAYWLSVQINMDFALGGQWGWWTKRDRKGFRAAWMNPQGGFGVGCKHYRIMLRCIGHLGEGPDFSFVLYGERKLRRQR